MSKIKASSLMVKISFLENQHYVDCALPGLAKKHGIAKKEAWQILKANLETVGKKIKLIDYRNLKELSTQGVNLHMQIQKWCKANRDKFATFGLNVFLRHKIKASDHKYSQLAVIVLLDEIFACKSYIQKEIARGHEKVEKPSIRQRLRRWWKNFKYNLLK